MKSERTISFFIALLHLCSSSSQLTYSKAKQITNVFVGRSDNKYNIDILQRVIWYLCKQHELLSMVNESRSRQRYVNTELREQYDTHEHDMIQNLVHKTEWRARKFFTSLCWSLTFNCVFYFYFFWQEFSLNLVSK